MRLWSAMTSLSVETTSPLQITSTCGYSKGGRERERGGGGGGGGDGEGDGERERQRGIALYTSLCI